MRANKTCGGRWISRNTTCGGIPVHTEAVREQDLSVNVNGTAAPVISLPVTGGELKLAAGTEYTITPEIDHVDSGTKVGDAEIPVFGGHHGFAGHVVNGGEVRAGHGYT